MDIKNEHKATADVKQKTHLSCAVTQYVRVYARTCAIKSPPAI